MPNTGNLFPGTAETVARGTTPLEWTSPTNVLSDNAVDATCAGTSTGSDYLVCRNFGLALATGDTVGGITIRVEASEHSGGTEVLSAQLQDNTGALIGTAKTVTLSGTSKAVYTYGSTTDLWGATLTETIVNSPNFGVRLWYTTSHTVNIDFVTGSVEYALAPVTGEGGGPFPPGVFPGPIFPGPIFPGAEGEDVTAALTGVSASIGFTGSIILPNITQTLPSVLLSGTVGFVTAEGNIIATLSGVAVNATAGTVAVGDRSKVLLGATANVSAGLVVKGGGLLVLQGVEAQAGSIVIGPGGTDCWGGSWGTSWGASWGTGGAEEGSSVGFVVANNAVGTSGVTPTGTVSATGISKLQTLTGVVVNAQSGFVTGGADKLASLTGVEATATAGVVITSVVGVSIEASAGTISSLSLTVVLSGAVANAAAETLVSDKARSLLGASANATAGTVLDQPAVTLNGVTATATAGVLPIPPLNGVTPSVAVGTVGLTRTVGLSGVAASAIAGNAIVTVIGLTGVAVNAQAGFVTAGSDIVANLTGVSANATAGTVSLGESIVLVGVVANATAETVTVADRSFGLSGVLANAEAGTVTAVPDREATLTGVQVYGTAYYVTTGNDIVTPLTIGAISSVAGSILEVQRISTLAGSGVDATGIVGTPGTTPDRQQLLNGVAAVAAAGLIQRESVTLTGVGVDAAAGNVDNNVQKTLAAVRANATVGFIVPAGDELASLQGVGIDAEAGIVGVIPALPTGTYRHVAPGPARNGRIKDLEELEREMALMEE